MRKIGCTSALLMMVLSIGCGAGDDMLLGAKPGSEPMLKESIGEDPAAEESAAGPKTKEKQEKVFRFEGPWEVWGVPALPRCGWYDMSYGMRSEADVPHLGHTILTAATCVDAATGGFSQGEAVFTASNGDRLTATFWAVFDFVAWDPVTFVWEGPMQITRGMGRFENATGSLSSYMQYSPSGGWQTIEGTIAY